MEEVFAQIHQEFVDSEDFINYLKELDDYSEKIVSL